MTDLFTKKMQVVVHKSTNSEIIISDTEWYNGEINYNCLVPQTDEKGKNILCNATYSEREIYIKC